MSAAAATAAAAPTAVAAAAAAAAAAPGASHLSPQWAAAAAASLCMVQQQQLAPAADVTGLQAGQLGQQTPAAAWFDSTELCWLVYEEVSSDGVCMLSVLFVGGPVACCCGCAGHSAVQCWRALACTCPSFLQACVVLAAMAAGVGGWLVDGASGWFSN